MLVATGLLALMQHISKRPGTLTSSCMYLLEVGSHLLRWSLELYLSLVVHPAIMVACTHIACTLWHHPHQLVHASLTRVWQSVLFVLRLLNLQQVENAEAGKDDNAWRREFVRAMNHVSQHRAHQATAGGSEYAPSEHSTGGPMR